MENTIEKQRIFMTQYWGQNIFGPYYYKINSSILSNPSFLNLKSRSNITNEDFIQAMKLLYIEQGYEFEDLDDKEGWDFILNTPSLPSVCVDFLRSKGYANAWMGLSVEKMVEYGWIKLIE